MRKPNVMHHSENVFCADMQVITQIDLSLLSFLVIRSVLIFPIVHLYCLEFGVYGSELLFSATFPSKNPMMRLCFGVDLDAD